MNTTTYVNEHPTENTSDPVIESVFYLESVFGETALPHYLIEPELPERSVTVLAGDSEAGKTTLACAWARDVMKKGHSVLLLDRDANPRERIAERFRRLGVDDPPSEIVFPCISPRRLWVWDYSQIEEPPLPNSNVVLDWVDAVYDESGLSPFVIIDSLVTNLTNDESENDSVHMRRAISRCRAITKAGGTVLLIHHLGHNGKVRGSSDLRPAVDQGFICENYNPEGKPLLWQVTLSVFKSRYGLSEDIVYRYDGGAMIRHTGARESRKEAYQDVLRDLLKANLGISSSKLESLAKSKRIARNKVRDWIVETEQVVEKKGKNNARLLSWTEET